jgi:hypothetical protein
MTWTRHARTILAHELLLGRPTSDPRGWYSKREFPKPGSKRERVARKALANAIRWKDEFVLQFVADMIDPRTDSAIIRQKIEFAPAKDRRLEHKTSGRRDIEIAAFMHERRAQGKSTQDAALDAAEHFGFAVGIIWEAWKVFKPHYRR